MCPVVLLAECLENVAFSPHVHGKCIIYTMYIVHITLYVFLLNYVYWSLSYTYTRQGNSPYPCPGLCLYWRAPLLYTTNSMMLIAAALSLANPKCKWTLLRLSLVQNSNLRSLVRYSISRLTAGSARQ